MRARQEQALAKRGAFPHVRESRRAVYRLTEQYHFPDTSGSR
jgi:hypothetical protein